MVLSHAHDHNCLFCEIVKGEIPAAVILDTGHALAFLDIHPVNKGHVLLVPKTHHHDLCDLDETVAAATAALLPRLCRAVKLATGADGFNVIINNGQAAGQTVDHGHWHIIPRLRDDPVNWPWPHAEYRGDELNQMRFAISRELDLSKN